MSKLTPDEKNQWFLVRGLTRESGHWGEFPRQLQNQIPHSMAHCLDLLGTGVYWKEKSPVSLAKMVGPLRTDFQKVLQQQPIAAPPVKNFLLAISMGAMVALDWVSRYPHDFAGVVLINPSVSGLSPLHKRLRWQAVPKMARAFVEPLGEIREKYILEMTSNVPKNFVEVAARYGKIQRQHPVSRANFFRQLLAAARFKLPERPPELPILLLTSSGDQMVDPSCSDALEKRWTLNRVVHPWAGHDLPLDDPKWILEAVSHWLKA